jgi:hypothetical protein
MAVVAFLPLHSPTPQRRDRHVSRQFAPSGMARSAALKKKECAEQFARLCYVS